MKQMVWEHRGLVTELLDGSSDAGDTQKPITPELRKHIYLQVRLNFFFSESFINHCCEKCVICNLLRKHKSRL